MISYGGYGGYGPYGPPMGRMPWEDPTVPPLPYTAPPPPQARQPVGRSIGNMIGDAAQGGFTGISGASAAVAGRGGGQARGFTGTIGDALKGAAGIPGRIAGGIGDVWGGLAPAEKAGGVMALIGTGADIYGAHQDRKRAKEQERYIRKLEEEEREKQARSQTAIAPIFQEYMQRRR